MNYKSHLYYYGAIDQLFCVVPASKKGSSKTNWLSYLTLKI